jgi:hypothetical protein
VYAGPKRIVHGEREADRVPEGSFRLLPSACFACIAFFICAKILPSWCCQQPTTDVLTGCNVGRAADLLVRAGATVVFSKVTEVRDGVDLLTARAATPTAAPTPPRRRPVRAGAWHPPALAS